MRSETPQQPAARSSRRAPHLERDKVVAAALTLLNQVGFEGLTLRKLADALGVKAAALYWHFKNKQDLIDHMASRIIDEELSQAGQPQGQTWRPVLTQLAYGTRGALSRYRDGALVIASADLSKSATYHARDDAMAQLFSQGLSADLILMSLFTIERYALGFVLEEQANPASLHLEVAAAREATVQYEALARAYTEAQAAEYLDADKRFDQGLQLILDGIAVRLLEQA